MIINVYSGYLPESLKAQYGARVVQSHKLWRMVKQGLLVDDLARRIEFEATTNSMADTGRRMRLSIENTDPLAIKLQQLADSHNLSRGDLFAILVRFGWQAFQTYGSEIGAKVELKPSVDRQEVAPSVKADVLPPAVTTAPMPEEVQAAPQKPQESLDETPEFKEMTRNMLASFGIDLGS